MKLVGIGRGMTASLLQRPSTTVVATVRDPSHETSASLSSLPTGENSKVVVLALDVKRGPATLVSDLASAGIDHLDIVIANAGGSSGYFPVLETDPQFLRDDFEVNVVGFMRLFQATWPLLSKSAIKKLAYISSSVGSIAALDEENMPGCTYGASKAAANWFAKKLSIDFKNEGLKVGIIHPG
jgi:norsolorinic acid ketoreductase